MKIKFFGGFVFVFLLPLFLQAQGMHHCGTGLSQETFTLMRDRAWNQRQIMDQTAVFRDDEIIYIPISYNVFGKEDQTATARVSDILGLHCKLNEEYAPHEIQFYMNDGINFLYNDDVYPNPGNFPGYLNANRATDAINVWIGQSADLDNDGLGITLGYYDPNNNRDWIVMRKSEATYNAETLAHEVGHFLSLNHPFLGWDCTFYEDWQSENPDQECAPTTAPCFNIPVERQNGTNCNNSADFLCDTPPDYNLGFQASGCAYNGNACDPLGTQVEPMVTNIMSYFDGCADPEFTDDQIQMVLINYNSSARNYLRIDDGPNTTDPVGGAPQITYPADGEQLDNYNVSIGWEAVDNAEFYLVETALNSGFSLFLEETVVSGLGVTLDYLQEGVTYYMRVTAFNELTGCVEWSDLRTFTTGDNLSSVDQIDAATSFVVVPNPAKSNTSLSLNVTAKEDFTADLQLVSVNGQLVYSQSVLNFTEGENTLRLDNPVLSAGIYFAVLRSENGVLNQKIVITK